jgi:hypothetical protein
MESRLQAVGCAQKYDSFETYNGLEKAGDSPAEAGTPNLTLRRFPASKREDPKRACLIRMRILCA